MQTRVVYGYELLFRSGPQNFFDGSHADAAAASAVDNLFLFGIERLTQGRRAFLNCTRDFFLRDFPSTLPPDRVVLEVLQTIQPDEEIVAACRRLKNACCLIALDGFQESPAWLPLTELAAFIKIDLLASSELEQQRLARAFAKKDVRLIAEKVESHDGFSARSAGAIPISRATSSAGRRCSPGTTFPRTSSTTCVSFRRLIGANSICAK